MNENKTSDVEDCHGTQNYMAMHYDEIEKGDYDPITLEELKKAKHPRATIAVRTNGILKYYYTKSIINIFKKGRGMDPFLRTKFPDIVRKRAELYDDCLKKFPDIEKNFDPNDIYERWITGHNNDLEASALLQPSDIIKYFEKYCGTGSMENRKHAEKALNANNTWLLRFSSIKSDKYNKAYVLSQYQGPDTYTHYLIIHKMGIGFYYNVQLFRGQQIPDKLEDENIKMYPSIIELIKKEVYVKKLASNAAATAAKIALLACQEITVEEDVYLKILASNAAAIAAKVALMASQEITIKYLFF